MMTVELHLAEYHRYSKTTFFNRYTLQLFKILNARNAALVAPAKQVLAIISEPTFTLFNSSFSFPTSPALDI